MDFAQYRRLGGINWSSLKEMAQSPRHYQHALMAAPRDKRSYSLGRAVHCAVLEPDVYATKYVARPPGIDLRTKEGKSWLEEHRHLEMVTEDVGHITTAVTAHPAAMTVLGGLQTEYTIQWQGHAGVQCKARLDAVGDGKVVDLKTTSRPLDRFYVEAAQYHYHGQLAYYLDGAISAQVLPPGSVAYIVAVETRPPYDVGVFLLSEQDVQAGRVLYRHCIDQLQACTATGLWPGRYPTIAPLSLPIWADGMGETASDGPAEEEVW